MQKIILLTAFCTVSACLSAQVKGNYQRSQQNESNANNISIQQYRSVPKVASIPSDNVVEININALSNQQSSSYIAIFSVTQLGKTADETNTLLNQRLDAFLGELKSLGIPGTDIYVDMVNFLPKFEYDVSKKIFSKKTYTEIPKGFELQKNIHIRYKKSPLLDQIVTAAAHQEIYDIVKVDYTVENAQAIYADLRAATFSYLNDIKKQYQSINIRLDSAYQITAENAWVAYPINRYESYRAFSGQSIDVGDKNADINSADKIVSHFYNAVPANDYDIVINPEILEPVVQFSYNLVVRFTLPERKLTTKTEVKKEFILVTPTGEVKTLKID
jgi:uncharacterized protein YggE